MPLKIKLIEPPALKLICNTGKQRFALPTVRTHFPKIQLQILSSALRNSFPDANVEVIDMKMSGQDETHFKTFEHDGLKFEGYRFGMNFDKATEQIIGSDVVGISSPFTQTATIVTDLAKHIKRESPSTKLVVGGYDTVTSDRQRFYLANGFDKVIPRNGETEFPRWIESEFGLSNRSSALELIVLGNDKRPARRLAYPLPDLDNFDIPSYIEAEDGALPKGAKYPIGYFVSSRGCDRTCEFCTIWAVNKREYNVMTLKDVENLLRHYKKHGVTTLLHAESNLLTRLAYGKKGSQNLIGAMKLMRDYGFTWEFFDGIEFGRLVREDGSPNDELIELLFKPEFVNDKLVGGYRAYIPIEAGYDERRKAFDKLQPNEVQNRIIQKIVETGVRQLSFGTILGFPEETLETVETTKRRANELRRIVDGASNGQTESLFIFYVHSLFPGSVDYKKYRNLLSVNIEKHPELFQLYTSCKPSRGLPAREITLLRRRLDYEFNGKEVNGYCERTGRAPTLHPVI